MIEEFSLKSHENSRRISIDFDKENGHKSHKKHTRQFKRKKRPHNLCVRQSVSVISPSFEREKKKDLKKKVAPPEEGQPPAGWQQLLLLSEGKKAAGERLIAQKVTGI